jgi:hypothetical protein
MGHFNSRAVTVIASCFMSSLLMSVSLAAQAADVPPDGYRLKDFGSFSVGGKLAAISGKPVKVMQFAPGGAPARVDPNGEYQIDQMYVQYFVPFDAKGAVPLLLWHGGGLTGVTYETTPDGRPGWLQNFVLNGWTVYNSDAMERGRSGFPPPELIKGEPIFLTTANPFGSVDIYDLREMDIHGNSHVMMMDRNSRQIADLIDDWQAKRELKH